MTRKELERPMGTATEEPAAVVHFRTARPVPELDLEAGQEYTQSVTPGTPADNLRLVARLMREGALSITAAPTIGAMATVTLAVLDRGLAAAEALPESQRDAELERQVRWGEQMSAFFGRMAGGTQ